MSCSLQQIQGGQQIERSGYSFLPYNLLEREMRENEEIWDQPDHYRRRVERDAPALENLEIRFTRVCIKTDPFCLHIR
jgi:hypothetical protein